MSNGALEPITLGNDDDDGDVTIIANAKRASFRRQRQRSAPRGDGAAACEPNRHSDGGAGIKQSSGGGVSWNASDQWSYKGYVRRRQNLGIKGEGELKKLLQEAGRDTRRIYVRHTPPRSAPPAKAPSRPPGDGWTQYEDHGVLWWYYEGPLGKWWWFCKDGQEPAPVRESDWSDEVISTSDSDECWV